MVQIYHTNGCVCETCVPLVLIVRAGCPPASLQRSYVMRCTTQDREAKCGVFVGRIDRQCLSTYSARKQGLVLQRIQHEHFHSPHMMTCKTRGNASANLMCKCTALASIWCLSVCLYVCVLCGWVGEKALSALYRR